MEAIFKAVIKFMHLVTQNHMISHLFTEQTQESSFGASLVVEISLNGAGVP